LKAFLLSDFLSSLCAIPHRAAGSQGEQDALHLLEAELQAMGVDAQRELFKAPHTYIPLLWWVSLALALAITLPAIGTFFLALVFFGGAVFYFDWRKSFLTSLPPFVQATNLWAKKGSGKKRLILMAHHDSAPASFAYRPSQVKSFRQSILMGLGVMIACLFWAFLQLGSYSNIWVTIALLILLAVQLALATFDFLRFGYTNAANDNGTGVAAVLATVKHLWSDVPDDWSIEVLFTGAEEAGMIGAQKWVDAHLPELDRENVYVLNIDTVGAGRLHYVEKTGTLTTLHYDNQLVDTARQMTQNDPQFSDVQATAHRVADFDSVWFARAGIASITLGAYDENGLMPHIHRPEDTLDKVDVAVVQSAVDFATALSRRVMISL